MSTAADPFAVVGTNAQGLLHATLAQLPNIAFAIVVFLIFAVVARLVRRGLRRASGHFDRSLSQMVSTLAYTSILVLGLLIALWVAIPNVHFTDVFGSVGVTSIVLGFALKDIMENFISGMIILWRRPFFTGDQIRSGGFEGTVEDINFRATVLTSYDGVRIFLPNSQVLTKPVENLTAYRRRRITVTLGIDQKASVARARQVILETLPQIEGVLPDPKPMVLFDAVGDSSNTIVVLFWTQPPNRLAERISQSEVTERLYTILQEEGINFPYPINTVQIIPPDDGSAPIAATGLPGIPTAADSPPQRRPPTTSVGQGN